MLKPVRQPKPEFGWRGHLAPGKRRHQTPAAKPHRDGLDPKLRNLVRRAGGNIVPAFWQLVATQDHHPAARLRIGDQLIARGIRQPLQFRLGQNHQIEGGIGHPLHRPILRFGLALQKLGLGNRRRTAVGTAMGRGGGSGGSGGGWILHLRFQLIPVGTTAAQDDRRRTAAIAIVAAARGIDDQGVFIGPAIHRHLEGSRTAAIPVIVAFDKINRHEPRHANAGAGRHHDRP